MRHIEELDTKSFADAKKMEFYGTVGSDGAPHITLFNSMYGIGGDTFTWGEYCHGYSKVNQKERPHIAVLAVDEALRMEYGHVRYHHGETAGELFELYNSVPRYRYNTIFGYSPVHFVTVLEWNDRTRAHDPSLGLRSKLAAGKIHPGSAPDAISVLTRRYFEAERGFKVIGWVDEKGVMQMAPIPQCALSAANRAVFALPGGDSPSSIGSGVRAAIYCVDLSKMHCVLVKGEYRRMSHADADLGVVEIDTVYNPMMPKNGVIYPRAPMKPVRAWKNALREYNV
ncbi:MAG: hypothetical protein LBL51_00845 [Synergistaceae bacterium]|nr:hypothetical protein [Synergistaceae bacterium]